MPSYGELVEDVAELEKLIAKKHENDARTPLGGADCGRSRCQYPVRFP